MEIEIQGDLSYGIGDEAPTNDPSLRRRELRPLQVGPRLIRSNGPAGNTSLAFLHLTNRFWALLMGLVGSGSALSLASEQRLSNAMAKVGELFYIGFARGRTRWEPPVSRYSRTSDLEALALDASIALWGNRPEARDRVLEFQNAVGISEVLDNWSATPGQPTYGPVTRRALGYFGRLWQEETPPESAI